MNFLFPFVRPACALLLLLPCVPAGEPPAGPVKRTHAGFTAEDRAWWAIQPLRTVAPPVVDDQAGQGNPVDRFLRDRLRREGLSPAPEAEPSAFLRRVTFGLTGLPPTPEEVEAFLADWSHRSSDAATAALMDRLLDSPRYGERMARWWLDLVRYADSDGYRIDDYRPNAWRYREYAIAAFNGDTPYDRFISEQLAGDELFPGDPRALTATGYLRHWIYEYNNRDARTQWDTILNDITDTTSDVFLGLGMQCARCHNHKFDPILQKDYFRLRAYFAPLLPYENETAATAAERATYAKHRAAWEEKTKAIRDELAKLEQPYRDKAEKEAVSKFPEDIQAIMLKPAAERTPYEAQITALAWRQVEYEWGRLESRIKGADKEQYIALRKKLASFDAERPAPLPDVMSARDVGTNAPPTFIPKKSTDPIDPGILSLINERPADIQPQPGSTGRRAALAQWLTTPENPLTARVLVNRVWQLHFGRGLAPHSSDFGHLGEPPSHPELLDWLASWFMREGWSIKKLNRLLLTSAAYRQSSIHPSPAAGQLKDPENKLLWRFRPHRLEAEQIRDALFAVSGELKLDSPGAGVPHAEPRRSIYTRIMRNTRDPLCDAFDAPLWFTSAASRDTTTTPIQSLLLVNSPFLLTRARALASRVERTYPGEETKQIEAACRLAFGRSPRPEELKQFQSFLAQQRERLDATLASSSRAAFVPEKMPFRDGQAAAFDPDGPQRMLRVTDSATLVQDGDFTIEAFVLPRSVYDSGAVRTIASKWRGNTKEPGWSLGITGQQSRRKPQTLALQMVGKKRDGTFGEAVAFSDHHLALHKPYYVAAAVTLATPEAEGKVTFYFKDLSNDDDPLFNATVGHELAGGLENREPLILGGRSGGADSFFHGIIDDVRLARGALPLGQLLHTAETATAMASGWWRFEPKPDALHDNSGQGHTLEPIAARSKSAADSFDAAHAAMADLCHAFLNASEFLYVE